MFFLLDPLHANTVALLLVCWLEKLNPWNFRFSFLKEREVWIYIFLSLCVIFCMWSYLKHRQVVTKYLFSLVLFFNFNIVNAWIHVYLCKTAPLLNKERSLYLLSDCCCNVILWVLIWLYSPSLWVTALCLWIQIPSCCTHQATANVSCPRYVWQPGKTLYMIKCWHILL